MPRDLKAKPAALGRRGPRSRGSGPVDSVAGAPAGIRAPSFSSLQRDGRLGHRTNIDPEIVAGLAELMRGGQVFPPVTVRRDSEHYWLSGGFHRIAAAKRVTRTKICGETRIGTFADAQSDSYAANATRGLRRTRSEAEAVIRLTLQRANASTPSNVPMSKHWRSASPDGAPR